MKFQKILSLFLAVSLLLPALAFPIQVSVLGVISNNIVFAGGDGGGGGGDGGGGDFAPDDAPGAPGDPSYDGGGGGDDGGGGDNYFDFDNSYDDGGGGDSFSGDDVPGGPGDTDNSGGGTTVYPDGTQIEWNGPRQFSDGTMVNSKGDKILSPDDLKELGFDLNDWVKYDWMNYVGLGFQGYPTFVYPKTGEIYGDLSPSSGKPSTILGFFFGSLGYLVGRGVEYLNDKGLNDALRGGVGDDLLNGNGNPFGEYPYNDNDGGEYYQEQRIEFLRTLDASLCFNPFTIPLIKGPVIFFS